MVLTAFSQSGNWIVRASGGPQRSLTMDAAGNLYGTTYSDGTHGYGSVFKVAAQQDGIWLLTDLRDFTGVDDGRSPLAAWRSMPMAICGVRPPVEEISPSALRWVVA